MAQASGITAEGKGQTDGKRQRWWMMAGMVFAKQNRASAVRTPAVTACTYKLALVLTACRRPAEAQTRHSHSMGGGYTKSRT